MKTIVLVLALLLAPFAVAQDAGLYMAKDKTLAGVFADFSTVASAAPIIAAGTNFLIVDAGGGGCPSWSVYAPFVEVNLDLSEYLCSGVLSEGLAVAGFGLLVTAVYFAIKVAFL